MLSRRTVATLFVALLVAAPGCRRGDDNPQDPNANPGTTATEPGQPVQGVTPGETVPGQPPPASADIRPSATDDDVNAVPRGGTAREAPRPAGTTRGTTGGATAGGTTGGRGTYERDMPVPATGGTAAQEMPSPARQVERAAPEIHTLPVGTVIDVEMLDGLSSATSQPGDGFRARVTRPVSFDGVNVIPAGAELSGTVTSVKKLAKIGGRAELALEFSRLELPNGHAATLHGSVLERGKSETGRDVATIGGATAGGAVLGRVLSKKQRDRNTAIGAVIGAAAGTVIASRTEGEQVELPPGAALSFQLDAPADVPVSR